MNLFDDDAIRVVSWNVEHSGIDRDGSTNRWHLAMDVLDGLSPHIVFRQELTSADRDGAARLHQEAERLAMTPFLAPATPESPNATGVFIDPDLFAVHHHYTHTTRMWHPISNPVVTLRGTTKKISLASVHLCSYDPTGRATEAKRLTILADQGRTALFAGDMNSYTHREHDELEPLPNWAQIEDPVHYEHRTTWRDGQRVSDTEPDRILAAPTPHGNAIFTELGHHAATTLGQHQALLPTANLRRTDQGPPQRIDRMYSTPDLAAALRSVQTILTDEVRRSSDHAPVCAVFSRTALEEALRSSDADPAVADLRPAATSR